jgi:8-hydroxy-5-deazaflavin:NADPH oxidoreductase
MRIAVMGTGEVGRTIAGKLVRLGHEVRLGSRTANNAAAAAWVADNGSSASAGTFADAASFAEQMVFNCTAGAASLTALTMAGEDALADKVLVDVANAYDFSHGGLPILFVCNTDSLAERIQRMFPRTRVVKALNTLNCDVAVDPDLVSGKHTLFMAGDDAEAKRTVTRLLGDFGWSDDRILDLGDLTTARAMEMLPPMAIRLTLLFGTPHFNMTVERAVK